MANYDKESDSQAFWNEEGGSKWVENIDLVEGMMVPLSEELLKAVDAKPGEKILDVGCGGGLTSFRLAEQVGEQGSVLGVDVSEPILEVARQRSANATGIEFEQADAGSAELGENQFDVITSRFGVMFFDDPVQAFSNLQRALKPSGRLVFMCWRGIEENPWLGDAARAAFGVVGPPAEKPDPKAPGPFSLGDAEHTEGILENAGFRDIQLEAMDKVMPFGQLDDVLAFLMKMGPVAEATSEADEGQMLAVEAAVREALGRYDTNEGLRTPGATWIVRAAS